ncbi:hypothetical protein THUN1379_20790 [Paludibacterium sp. THUN1379]|nr:hypothetical protein THUN1379_20790 [Paludibacterium sp. THUN1379]
MMKYSMYLVPLLALWMGSLAQAQDERIHYGIAAGPAERYGASFLPPAGPGWQMERNRAAGVDLIKPGPSRDENQQIDTALIRVDQPELSVSDFLPILRRHLESGYAEGKLKLVTLDLKVDARLKRCIRGHLLLVDDTQNEAQGKWYSEQYLLSCRFAPGGKLGTEIRYYQRYFDGHQDLAFAQKANQLLDSVELAS